MGLPPHRIGPACPGEVLKVDRNDRRLFGLALAGASAAHAAATKRVHPLHLVAVLIGLLGGLGDGPAGAGVPARKR